MHDVGQIILGLMMSIGIIIVVPLCFIAQDTKAREEREKEETSRKSDCP